MPKQKKGFFLFVSSLIPGAGELYMGFQKMGLSISILFWGCILCAGNFSFDALLFVLPVIWLYSFFHVHNLKSLTEEEFLSIEDHFLIPTDGFIEDKKNFVRQYRKMIAVILIILGITGVWQSVCTLLWQSNCLSEKALQLINTISSQVPLFTISVILVILGIRMVLGKKEALSHEKDA